MEEVLKILAIEQELPGKTSADFAPHLQDEARQVWMLYQQGVIREFYFHRDDHVAVLMLECEDVEEAGRILDALPLVRAGVIRFQVIPLVPYDGFSRLFAGE